MRTPSSLVRRATANETVRAIPTRERTSAMQAKKEKRIEKSLCCVQMG
jgi:hypothetical protein